MLAASGDGGLPVPSMTEFYPPAIWFEGTIFAITRMSLVRWVAVIALIVLFVLVTRRAKLIPGRAQSIAEMGLDFVRVNIAEEVLGKHKARPYVPLLTTMFFAILFMNLTGIVPGLNIASTSVVAMPLLLAVVSWFAFVWAGVRTNGAVGYLRSTLFPPGVPKVLYIILTPIEFLSTFILRPLTLTIRLLANMLVGHLLLVLCFGATHFLFFEAAGGLKAMGVVTFGAAFAFTIFEIFISALQAFIFPLLTAVYIQLSEEAH